MEPKRNLGPNTLLQHFGEEDKVQGAVVPPIFQNSLFVFDTIEDLAGSMTADPTTAPHHYSRVGNPSLEIVEKKLAMMEGTECCKLLGSGQAALTVAIMSCVQQGDHVVCVDTAYGPVRSLLSDYLVRFGVSHTFVDGREVAEIESAIRPNTKVIYLETPSSLVFRFQDLEAVAKLARTKEIATICDNTYATPLFMKPHSHGIDIVCHSATKYLGGHSDLTAGAICTSKERMDRIIRQEINLLGNILHPFQAWLLHRGMRTLSVRLARHQETANAVARWLDGRNEADVVHYVGLDAFSQRSLFQKYMTGAGGLLSFEPVCQDPEEVRAFVNRLKIFQRGVSWGGFESLAIAMPIQPLGYSESRMLVRLFCGLEDALDLIADLEQAFR